MCGISQYDRRSGRVGFGQAACQAIGLKAQRQPCPASGADGSREDLNCGDGLAAPGEASAAAGGPQQQHPDSESYQGSGTDAAEGGGTVVVVTDAGSGVDGSGVLDPGDPGLANPGSGLPGALNPIVTEADAAAGDVDVPVISAAAAGGGGSSSIRRRWAPTLLRFLHNMKFHCKRKESASRNQRRLAPQRQQQ